MTITFSRVIPTLRMFDIARAREFYLDYLGFKVDFEHRFEPDLPLFLGISRGGLAALPQRASWRRLARRPHLDPDDRACGLSRRTRGQGIQLHAPGP